VAEALFYLLAALALVSAVGVVRARVPLFSVLSLLGTFLCLSAIYLLCGFPFLAATQLLVYAGAIMVLFLFVIMLLNLGDAAELARNEGRSLTGRRLAVAGVTAGLLGLIGLSAAGLGERRFVPDPAAAEHGLDSLDTVAALLFGRYVLPFEAASLLLLATMIAVIVLAKRQRGRRATPRAARSAAEAEAEEKLIEESVAP
jgi:NADH-quinone oxidoreductase subunit J